MVEKRINSKSAHPTPPHTNPMELGAINTFLGSRSKKTKIFMIFDLKKGGGSDIFAPPPPHPPSKAPNSGLQVGAGAGGGGGSGPKTHWGMCLLDRIMILQGVKQTIQPLEVRYRMGP